MHADTARRSCADEWRVSVGVPTRAAPTRSSTWRGKVRAKGATPAGASDTGAKIGASASAQDAHDPRGPGAKLPAWGLSPREWGGGVQSELLADTPSPGSGCGQPSSGAWSSQGPAEGCGTSPLPLARADTRSMSARAEEPRPQGLWREEARWLPRYGRAPAPHSPAPGAPPLQMRSWPDQPQDPVRDRLHCADPVGPQSQRNAVAEGTARDAQYPTDAQGTPSPASPEIDTERAERGIALAVNAGLPDLGGSVGEESEGL
ncbi:unnamed protein product [Closterium sp. Yama58-4]|nr:unnamed protein product [Closterium sp. Yama58-4]